MAKKAANKIAQRSPDRGEEAERRQGRRAILRT